MKFDATIFIDDLKTVPQIAQSIEKLGFDALWIPETTQSPHLAMALAAQATSTIELGTGITVAFARSPMLTAYEAWGLAHLSDGRFMLGLGSQIKVHIAKRFGMTWDKPGPRMREYIQAIHAAWQTFQTNARLNFRGDYYTLAFSNPMFQPAPIDHPDIPVYLAAVGPYMCRVAGELCNGVHVHAFHTMQYLQEVTLPRIKEGLQKSGRSRADITLNSAIFVATNDAEKVLAKTQIAFYASTPAYRGVLDVHGWGDLQDNLIAMTRRGKWNEMHTLISDEMLATVGVVADAADLGQAVRERYDGVLDRIGYYLPYMPDEKEDFWAASIAAFRD